MSIATLSIEDAAKAAAGNWRKFDSFAWHERPEHPEQWTIVYTSNRDSDLLEQSNHAVIAKTMTPFLGRDARAETHSHWGCGHVSGYSIRVYKRGRITKAFKTWCELKERLADYPVLDETDYSQREYDATVANIADAAWRLKQQYEMPNDWAADVYGWFSDNDYFEAIENHDDRGGYPTEDHLRDAFAGLGYKQ